jgi:hypothetical protein
MKNMLRKSGSPAVPELKRKEIRKGEETMQHTARRKAITVGLAMMLLTSFGQAQSSSAQSTGEMKTSPATSLPVTQAKPSGEGIQSALGWGSYSTYFTLRSYGYLLIWCPDSRINSNSRVFVSASEYSDIPSHRFVGAAHFVLQNIQPANGGVVVLLNTNWTAFPINIRLDVLVDP